MTYSSKRRCPDRYSDAGYGASYDAIGEGPVVESVAHVAISFTCELQFMVLMLSRRLNAGSRVRGGSQLSVVLVRLMAR